ncbi:hypothetical protein [Allorhodopirellula solitaria]|uniref:Secreted protein n=1 Tax=Allorhodopirellula solitaria TaxID=2527987 RepID=A0A5C5YG56_9BACT|nr:hypothetical protein [Allorhodopirellula solitaria]TWT73939.1 hypothetical protein CA85_08210 [Allorhodopirellula solitaria]
MIDLSVWKSVRRIGLAMLLLAALPISMTSAQQDMKRVDPFAQPNDRQLKVVIMLGSDYDFSTPPFLNANTVLEYLSKLEDGAFTPPRFENVELDVETPLPHEHHVTVIAAVPPEMDEAEREKFKKKIQLISLRYGINHVEVISGEPSSSDGTTEAAVWLRLPFMKTDEMKVHLAKYAKIAVALADSAESSTHQARIDIYELPSADGDPFSNYVASPYTSNDPGNPFGQTPTASDESVKRVPLNVVDPFARDNESDSATQRNSSPFDDVDGSSKPSSRKYVKRFKGESQPTSREPSSTSEFAS